LKDKSNWKRVLIGIGIALIYALPLVTVRGAFDAFLKIDGVPGESTDDKHKEWIEIESFQHGVSQPAGGTASGGARSAQRSEHDDLTVVKTLDKASPKLLLFCCNGSHIKSVTLVLCRTDGDKEQFMQYKLSDVLVSSIKPSGMAEGSDSRPSEEVSFNYGKIEWSYTLFDKDTGKPSGTVDANWDLVTDKGN
jgi:type VI secretion system secreted protein Hcp